MAFTNPSPRYDSQPTLCVGVDSSTGQPIPILRDPVTGGLVVGLGSSVVTAVPAVPTSGATFQTTLVANAVSVLVCAAHSNSRGKLVSNDGAVDAWYSFAAGNAVGVGILCPAGDFRTFQGSEAIFASSSGITQINVAEEYT